MIDRSAFRTADRIAGIGVSEILTRSAAAATLQRAGRDIIVLGAGEPDFDTPDHVKEAAARAIVDGKTKYTALDGSREMKEAVVGKFSQENGLNYAIDQITVGAGAKQVIYNAFMATLDPGDEVIIPTPYWTSYADMVRIAGGVPVEVACSEADGFLLRPDQLKEAISPRTRWLLLNSPSNPSGAAYDCASLYALAGVLASYPAVWILSDDMYEHILYDDRRFATFAQVAPDLAARTLTVNGVSKAYAMTGWRLGYGAGPAPLIAAIATVQSQATSCPSSISQAAAIAALSGPQDIVRDRTRLFQRRRDMVVARLNATAGLSCRVPEGAFYAFASCAGVIGSRTGDGTLIDGDRALADYLLTHGVAVIPGTCFGAAPYFRISYATSDDVLSRALDRIAEACAALSG